MWAQTGKRSINRHVFCCILTMTVKTYLLVRVVPNHSSKGADGVCWERTALQKPCLSPQSQILRAPKLGQAQSAGRDPFIPAPLALPKKPLPALLTSTQPLQSTRCQRQILGRTGPLCTCTPEVSAAQSSCSHPALKGYNPPMQQLSKNKRHKVTGIRPTSQEQNQKHHQPCAGACCTSPHCLLEALLCTKMVGF